MTGRRPTRPTRTLAVLAAVALVLTAAAPAGLVSADDGVVEFETDDDRLRIQVPQDELDGSTVTLVVAGQDRGTFESNSSSGDGHSFSVPFAKLTDGDRAMANERVEVHAGNGTDDEPLDAGRLNLQHFAFGESGDARFVDGKLRLPVERAVGFAGSVSLAVGDGDPVQATFVGNDSAVELDREEVREYFGTLRDGATEFAVRPPEAAGDAGTLSADVGALAAGATTVSRADDGLVVAGPLVFANESYRVRATDEDDGVFAGTETADADGLLRFGDETLATAESVNVTLSRDGDVVLTTGDRAVGGGVTTLSATVEANGTEIAVANASSIGGLPADLRHATLNTSDERVWLNASALATSNGTVDLSSVDRAVAPNGSYGLLLVGTDGTVVRALVAGSGSGELLADAGADGSTDGGDGTAGEGTIGTSEAGGSLLPTGDGKYVVYGGIVLVVAVLTGAITLIFMRARSRGSGGSGGGGAQGQAAAGAAGGAAGGAQAGGAAGGAGGGVAAQDREVTVEVLDDATGGRLDVDGDLVAEPGRGNGARRQTADLAGGAGTILLPTGRWTLIARGDGVNEAQEVTVRESRTVRLRVAPNEVTISVRDAETDDPVPEAEVVCRPDGGEKRTATTGDDGRVSFELSPDAGAIEVGARHDRYEETTESTAVGGAGGSGTLRLRPLTGGVRSTVTVGGRPTEGVPVELLARDAYVKRHREERHEATTDRSGGVAVDGLLAGTYEVRVAFPEGRRQFTTPSRMVEVRDGADERANLDVEFTYSLTPEQMNRMADVRERVAALSESSGRDVVVPRYYGSVVESLLDVVERLPGEGHRFAGAEVGPDELVDALLSAAEDVTDAVSAAMSSKRNTNLFGACSDLPDREVAWRDGFDVAALFDHLAAGRGEQRRRLQGRLDEVEDRVAAEQGELATLSPAREPLDEVADVVRSTPQDDDAYAAAVAFAADGLLDAVEGVLDDEELRKRLQRTVF